MIDPVNARLADLFNWGNYKMGKKVLTFSIPAVFSCIGSTSVCREVCYANTGFFKMPNVADKYQRNWDFTRTSDFVPVASKLLQKLPKNTLFRLHVAGDFYSAEYVRNWIEILKVNPQLICWAYTRSWRVSAIRTELVKLSKLPNVTLWFSVDKETGSPRSLPANIRTAYMMTADDDIPALGADLYFRDGSARHVVVKHINGDIVCPHENGITKKITCEKCKLCFRSEALPTFTTPGGFTTVDKRVSLQTV
jgi:hypothetical protein